MNDRRDRRSRVPSPAPDKTRALNTLLSAPGLVAFYDSAYGISLSGSLVTAWAPRVGSDTLGSVGTEPAYGSAYQGGKSGVTYSTGKRSFLVGASLATLLDGTQAFSALSVAKADNSAAAKVIWSCGDTVGSDCVRMGLTTTSTHKIRNGSGGFALVAGANVGTSAAVITDVYNGTQLNSYANGTQDVTSESMTGNPVCDVFSIGAHFELGYADYGLAGTVWGVLISTSQWTAPQRAALEHAANIYWGMGLGI